MSWVQSAPNPPEPRTLSHFRFFAVIGTWMEADVIVATMRNARAQGCEHVYLVDNDSPDDTVARAVGAGATLARSFSTERYDEGQRLQLMNEVVRDVSTAENADFAWWLFLDADEFPHGPRGMTLRTYLETLDERFRLVGARFFDHYPSAEPHYVPDRHPLEFQPLCEELAFPMCAQLHRKHSLQLFIKGRPAIECGKGFHLATCAEPLIEPEDAFFIHHFPYRQLETTRARLERLWAKNAAGETRAGAADTHMLARIRSLDAVYSQRWNEIQNFIALDPMYEGLDPKPPAFGVNLKPWSERVDAVHVPALNGDSPIGAWNYGSMPEFHYGDDTTYLKGLAFLDGNGLIEDWGCGFCYAKKFVERSPYVGIDGSSQYADKRVDLTSYVSSVPCVFMRHVLEHNGDWRLILGNAVKSFEKRMVLVLFTPFSDVTHVMASARHVTNVLIPDISFRREDLLAFFEGLDVREEALRTETQYGVEHVFYLERA